MTKPKLLAAVIAVVVAVGTIGISASTSHAGYSTSGWCAWWNSFFAHGPAPGCSRKAGRVFNKKAGYGEDY